MAKIYTKVKMRIGLALLLASILSFGFSGSSCFASISEMSEDLPDDYLGTEFAWVMVLNSSDAKYYLNYPGSKLSPLTKVAVRYRAFPQKSQSTIPTTTSYEDLWYKGEVPVGLRRYNDIAIPYLSNGAMIFCPAEDQPDLDKRASAIADAIVRLLVDVQLRMGVTALVLVPNEDYESVAAALTQFNFFPAGNGVTIQPINMRLRAYPAGKDQMLFLQSQK